MSTNRFDIAEMTIADYESVAELWRRTENIGLSEADSSENIAAYLVRNRGLSLVALVDGEIVGALLGGHDGRRGYLHHLAVSREFRRRGIGRALVNESLSRLKKLGVQKCHIFIFDENSAGKAFWIGAGWQLRFDLKVMSRSP